MWGRVSQHRAQGKLTQRTALICRSGMDLGSLRLMISASPDRLVLGSSKCFAAGDKLRLFTPEGSEQKERYLPTAKQDSSARSQQESQLHLKATLQEHSVPNSGGHLPPFINKTLPSWAFFYPERNQRSLLRFLVKALLETRLRQQ